MGLAALGPAALSAVGALGPALVRSSAQASWGLTRAGSSAGSRAARGAVSATLAGSAAVTRAATALLTPDSTRRVWTAGGRAQLQVWGPDGCEGPAVLAGVQQALATLDGVSWARVDAVTRRAVVCFDPARVATGQLAEVVADAERAAGVTCPDYPHDDASFPGDAEPVRLQAWALAADVAGLSAAVAGRLAGLPSLPGSAAAAVVLVDNQPRVRELLESRLGPAATDLALAVSTAAVQGLTQGVASLLVDTAQRTQAVLAARGRLDSFTWREAELAGPARPARSVPLARVSRPVPLPPGPVERHADRAAAGSLLAAGGLLAATGNADLAGRILLIGAPKAARAGREAFADTLTAGLSRRGLVVADPAALRRLDRIDTVIVDSTVLHDDRALVLSALPLSGAWTAEHVWSAAQRLLAGGDPLPLPPPRGRHRHRLALVEQPEPDHDTGLSLRVLSEDGAPVGQVLVGTELDPYADAVLSAGQRAGVRLVLTSDPAAPELAGRADEVLDGGIDSSGLDGKGLAGQVRLLQAAGRVVALVSAQEEALAAADVGIGVVPAAGRVPWAADVLCGPGLAEVPRLLAAVPAARAVSARGVTSATAASFLGALLSAVGGPARTARAVLPVTGAAAAALVSGTLSARQVLRLPAPQAVLHTPWHALEPDEVLSRLLPPAAGTVTPGAPAGRGHAVLGLLGVPAAALAPVGRLARNVRAELADPLTPVLATGAAASAVIGSPTDALLVGGVLAANALVSGGQRLRADQALRALLLDQQLPARLVQTAPVPVCSGAELRERQPHGASHNLTVGIVSGDARTVPASGLLPGQVIDLQTGDVVPADARLLAAAGLEVDEASLTGESAAVDKQTQATPGAELAARVCMVYEGTTVLAGSAQAVVVAVGPATEAGRALTLAGRAAAPAGMQARLEELTRRGLPVTLLGGLGVTGLALLRRQPLSRAIASGVSVAVAAVPEGLPLVATVAQRGAARRLSARGVLVRSARTVEALGRIDTVCFDKTGTLTEGRLRLARVAGLDAQWDPGDSQARRVLRAAARACPSLSSFLCKSP